MRRVKHCDEARTPTPLAPQNVLSRKKTYTPMPTIPHTNTRLHWKLPPYINELRGHCYHYHPNTGLCEQGCFPKILSRCNQALTNTYPLSFVSTLLKVTRNMDGAQNTPPFSRSYFVAKYFSKHLQIPTLPSSSVTLLPVQVWGS